jgi:GNAT superfamily N-acetyltransferase
MNFDEWRRDGFVVSTDPARIDRALIWQFIRATYWGEKLTEDRFLRSLDHALVFGLYGPDGKQVGFGRVVTDYARFAWLSDVFVMPELRGMGLGRWLTETIVGYPPIADVDRWVLATRDAHGVYRPLGFGPLPEPARYMLKSRG